MSSLCGFTIIRNAVKYDYPVLESIQSVLPICDKFIVLIGESEDKTEELIRSINDDKIEIHHSKWDDSLRIGGKVLAVETNKAFDLVPDEYDWAFYIQADEALHQKYYTNIKQAMDKWINNPAVDGFLFKYEHFYGSYDYVGDSRTWYRNEIRLIRNDKQIRSYKDAQGFRKNNQKLNVKRVEAYMYHYGWVKHPKDMKTKKKEVARLWHDEKWIKEHYDDSELFDYSQIDSISLFNGEHPKVMQKRIEKVNWNITLDTSSKKFGFKKRLLYWFEKKTGIRPFEYKNYHVI